MHRKKVLLYLLQKNEEPLQKTSPYQKKCIPEPLYASIKEGSIHRSNSMATLPSFYRDEGDLPWLNRSMEVDPIYGLGGVDHNLTYSYSSSDESLNESFSINFSSNHPRSAETSIRRPVTVKNTKQEITLQQFTTSHLHGPATNIHNNPSFRQSSPKKPVDSSDYLQKMYADMDMIDSQLEMVAKVEGENVKANIAKFDEENEKYSDRIEVDEYEDNASASLELKYGDIKLQKMEDMMSDFNRQSDELQKLFR